MARINDLQLAPRTPGAMRSHRTAAASTGPSHHRSLFDTCKLCGIDPQAYLADAMTKIVNGHPNSQIDELLPRPVPERRGKAGMRTVYTSSLLGRIGRARYRTDIALLALCVWGGVDFASRRLGPVAGAVAGAWIAAIGLMSAALPA